MSIKPSFYRHLDLYHFYKYSTKFLNVLFSPNSVLTPINTYALKSKILMSNVIKKALNGFSDGAVLSHRHAAYKSALNLALHDSL